MPDRHREYLNYNSDEFKEWARSVGKSTEEIVRYFLTSGNALILELIRKCVAFAKAKVLKLFEKVKERNVANEADKKEE